MTQIKYHKPIVPGSEVTAESANTPMSKLDEEITRLNNVLQGGDLVLPGDWDSIHIVMRGAHLWVNGGRLFYNTVEPQGPEDGTQIAP